MTALFVDGVHVVFEGVARLHWAVGPWRLEGPNAFHRAETVVHQRVLDHVWPRREILAHVRRQIDHGRRTLVVVDGREPIVTLPRRRVPQVPFGAVDMGETVHGERRLLIPRFNWLRDRERMRGEAFLERSTHHRTGLRADVVIERDLVGTREPLRFMFWAEELSLERLQRTIYHVFRPDLPLVPARQGSNGPDGASGPETFAA